MSQYAYPKSISKAVVKGENRPPDPTRISVTDSRDALLKQQGHGICKGLVSTWVIAFLNDVKEASDPAQFASWFELSKFQGAYIKNTGGHIDRHLKEMDERNLLTGVEVENVVSVRQMSSSDFPDNNPWAAYCSIWKHDIAFGYGSGEYFIMEPNDGLYVYDSESSFLSDANGYIGDRKTSVARRHPKRNTDSIGLYFCTGGWKKA